MPISKENLALYPANWKAISRRIRFERAGNRCEWCGVRNHAFGRWASKTSDVFHYADAGERDTLTAEGVKVIRIVLTVAHLNHDPRDNREENLAALCQRHHLRLDGPQHVANARATRERRSGQTSLFGGSR